MKISETDNLFWDLVGMLYHCDGEISQWSYNKESNSIKLTSCGETTIINLNNLNKTLEKEKELIQIRWKTGNKFDGKLEIE